MDIRSPGTGLYPVGPRKSHRSRFDGVHNTWFQPEDADDVLDDAAQFTSDEQLDALMTDFPLPPTGALIRRGMLLSILV